jgi:hypothetical protein
VLKGYFLLELADEGCVAATRLKTDDSFIGAAFAFSIIIAGGDNAFFYDVSTF